MLLTMSNDDVAKDEYMMAVSLEVIDIFLRTSKLLFDTDTSKVMTCNVDQTVSAEDKSEFLDFVGQCVK